MFHFLDRFEEALSSFLLALMVVTSILQVFFRYCVSYSLDWPEEMGRYLFIALVYIGSGYAERENKHLSITPSCARAEARGARNICLSWRWE